MAKTVDSTLESKRRGLRIRQIPAHELCGSQYQPVHPARCVAIAIQTVAAVGAAAAIATHGRYRAAGFCNMAGLDAGAGTVCGQLADCQGAGAVGLYFARDAGFGTEHPNSAATRLFCGGADKCGVYRGRGADTFAHVGFDLGADA